MLRHLESVGFDGAPRSLGVDAAGREVLSFIEGEVAGRPRPEWIADEDRLVSIARLVRRYDDAAASFGLADGLVQTPVEPAGIPPAPSAPPELIGHQDVTPEKPPWWRQAGLYSLWGTDNAQTFSKAVGDISTASRSVAVVKLVFKPVPA